MPMCMRCRKPFLSYDTSSLDQAMIDHCECVQPATHCDAPTPSAQVNRAVNALSTAHGELSAQVKFLEERLAAVLGPEKDQNSATSRPGLPMVSPLAVRLYQLEIDYREVISALNLLMERLEV